MPHTRHMCTQRLLPPAAKDTLTIQSFVCARDVSMEPAPPHAAAAAAASPMLPAAACHHTGNAADEGATCDAGGRSKYDLRALGRLGGRVHRCSRGRHAQRAIRPGRMSGRPNFRVQPAVERSTLGVPKYVGADPGVAYA
eukprot:365505-Chlamydomonas_euryale.AAC.2